MSLLEYFVHVGEENLFLRLGAIYDSTSSYSLSFFVPVSFNRYQKKAAKLIQEYTACANEVILRS